MSPTLAPLAVLLLGPTASGKSAVAMALAGRIDLELVSVDSAQVFKGLDIGSAKPSAQDQRAVPHHLIDIVEPEQTYSAARFAQDAATLIRQIHARGRLPLLVGGTMLYAQALMHGLHDLPGAHPGLRAELEREAQQLGWPALHARLARVDPITAARLAPNDAQRIQRALEVHAVSGRPLSQWIAARARRVTAPGAAHYLVIALEPSDRAMLHARIDARFHAMIERGLIDEVRSLRARPGLHPDLPSMRCVGYRQVWEWLDSTPSRPLRELIERGSAATRQLAKRQLTWLRGTAGRLSVDCLASDALAQVHAIVERARAAP